MARTSPLLKLQQEAEASLIPYGPPEAGVLLVETFGELELEYAALRKACILLDQPHRATLEVTGADRLEFLNRMVTQELKGLEPFHARRSFWLSRKGRIDADLRIIDLPGRMLLDLDTHAAERTLKGLAAFIVMEDCQIRDVSETTHRLALHGPTGPALLAAVSKPVAGPAVTDLAPGAACTVSVGGREVVVDRDDVTGEVGLELLVQAEDALPIAQQLIETGQEHDGNGSGGAEPASRFRLRPAGWHAFNIARIEAGRPLYNIDFGPDSLPHETGVLHDRVSFKKGCYLGQEIVARMESRGGTRRIVAALRCVLPDPAAPADQRPHPVTGAPVSPAEPPDSDPVGVVTSATLSPMLGSVPICFAAMKPAAATAGAGMIIPAEGVQLWATVQPTLVFWKRGSAPGT
jgi:folate-binding protein YgfZ